MNDNINYEKLLESQSNKVYEEIKEIVKDNPNMFPKTAKEIENIKRLKEETNQKYQEEMSKKFKSR